MARTFSSKVALAMCQRCEEYYKHDTLKNDVNYPSLRVCPSCLDEKNPYLLPPCTPDSIALRKPRPDTPIGISATNNLHWDTPGLTWDSGLTWDQTVTLNSNQSV